MTQPLFTQLTFRIRNDDGNETGASWVATQGSDATLETGKNYRCRFRIDETASRAWTNLTWNLYVDKNGGGYNAIGSGQAIDYALSSNFAQGDDTTTQLTGGTGTFLTDNNGMCESAGATNTGAAGNLFEVEYCFQIDAAQVVSGDVLTLRVYNGTAAIAAYTDSPAITVSEINVGEASLSGSSTLTVTAQPLYREGVASLSGSSELTATSMLVKDGVAVLDGSSALTVSAQNYKEGESALSSSSVLTVLASLMMDSTSSLSGSSTLTADAINMKEASSTLDATSTFIVAAILQVGGESVLQCSSTLTASATVTGGYISGILNYQIVGISVDLDGKVLIKGNVSKRSP